MKKARLLFFAVPALLIAGLIGCSKDSTGPTGATGATGSTGAAGPTGPTGNANIKDSNFTITTWSVSGAYDYVHISDPQITSTIMSSGEVLAYWSTDGGVDWDQLDWSSENPTGYLMEFNYALGQFTAYFSGGGSPNTAFSITSCEFKIVCMTNAAMKQHPNTNWHNYNEVMSVVAQCQNK